MAALPASAPSFPGAENAPPVRRATWYPTGAAVYAKGGRERWLHQLPDATQPLAELLYEEHDALLEVRSKAEKALLAEAKQHREWHLLKTCPGLGPVRTAELLPVVVTPYRFQSRSNFWGYCGLGVVMRTSSDWVRSQSGQWVKAPVQRTRGLNRNFNHIAHRNPTFAKPHCRELAVPSDDLFTLGGGDPSS